MLPEIPWRKDEKRRGLLKKKGLACLVLRILRRAEVCLCHQLLDHPHKTFSVSSTASQSSGRSSWPTKRPSLRIQQDPIPGPGFSMGFFPSLLGQTQYKTQTFGATASFLLCQLQPVTPLQLGLRPPTARQGKN